VGRQLPFRVLDDGTPCCLDDWERLFGDPNKADDPNLVSGVTTTASGLRALAVSEASGSAGTYCSVCSAHISTADLAPGDYQLDDGAPQ
jgi:hypothetical protein